MTQNEFELCQKMLQLLDVHIPRARAALDSADARDRRHVHDLVSLLVGISFGIAVIAAWWWQ